MAVRRPIGRESESVVTFDLQPLLVPFSIFFSALLIAVAIFFAGQSIAKSIDPSAFDKGSDTADDRDTGTGTDTGDTAVPSTTATTSIDDDAILGNPDAKVAIVEFSDYECPYCKRHYQQVEPNIIKNYVDSGKVMFVYRDFPLSFHDPAATTAAYAAECVRDQSDDKTYYKFHDKLFDASVGNGTGVTDDKMKSLASEVGVNGDKVLDCIESEKFKDEVANDISDASDAGINGTPGFVVGKIDGSGKVTGKLISGAQAYTVFEAAIKEALGE